MKKCPNCGCREFQVHQIEDHVIVINSDGEFVDERSEYTKTVHSPTDDDMWECDDCGFTAQGSVFEAKELALCQENISELVEQAVAIMEEILDDYEVVIPNDERDEAIANGVDNRFLKHIYGSDCKVISNVVEKIAQDVLAGKPVNTSVAKNQIMEAYEKIAEKLVSRKEYGKHVSLSFVDINCMKEQLNDLFENWGII